MTTTVETVSPEVAPATTTERNTQPGHTRPALLMLSPFLILYVLFIIGPTLYMVLMSFFDGSLTGSGLGAFGGFGNFAEAFGSADFWSSMWHTLWFTILTTPPLVVLALLFAMLANRVSRGRWFFRLAFFLPYVLPSAVVALIWIWLYTPEIGLLSKIVTTFGFDEPSWLGSPSLAMWSLAITTVWWTLGFNFVLFLAGLQDIPRDLYEASSIDGASPWQQIRRITIPLLNRTTALVVVLQVIASLKVFDQMYIMTSGGPNYSTRSMLEYVYDLGFTDLRTGYAAAASTVFFVLVLAISTVWVVLTRRQEQRF